MYYLGVMVDFYKQSHRNHLGVLFFRYKLHLGSASGTAQNGKADLSFQKDMYFSTFDRDNDAHGSDHCAITWHGAWWYNGCHRSNLNGLWGEDSPKGVSWHTGGQKDISLLHRDESEESAQQYQWLIEPVHIETEGKDEVRVFVCEMGRDFEIVRAKCRDSLISSSSTKNDQPEIMTTFNLFSGTT